MTRRTRTCLAATLSFMLAACGSEAHRDGSSEATGASDADAGSASASTASHPRASETPSDTGGATGSTSNTDESAPSQTGSDGTQSSPAEEADGGLSNPGATNTDDADARYTGHYGQPIWLRLPYLNKAWSIDKNGVLTHVADEDPRTRFIIEYVRATDTSNTNTQYQNRMDGVVYLRDVFHLRLFGSQSYVYFDDADRSFKVGEGHAPAEFLLTNKYGSNVTQVDTDAYCKGVYDSFEYYEDVNNRNTSCGFPYQDCYGRCAYRKLFFVQDGKYKVVGLSTKAPTDRVTIDGITGYQSYEYLLP